LILFTAKTVWPLRFRTHFLSLFVALCAFAVASRAQGPACITGTWTNDDATARIQIYATKTGGYAGRVVWLKEPNHDGQPKVDRRNPDEKLRTRPIMGLIVLKGFKPGKEGGTVYDDGSIYDPKNGKTYDCKMTCLDGGRKLSIRGYMGISMIGRSTVWTRVKG
jgi:uncharacterized protein (DUF2147 family)